jgi:hypothetical protein
MFKIELKDGFYQVWLPTSNYYAFRSDNKQEVLDYLAKHL